MKNNVLTVVTLALFPLGFASASEFEETNLSSEDTSQSDVSDAESFRNEDSPFELINGNLAGTKRPEVVRVRMLNPILNEYENCTATRIGERHFLTAAHCFVDLNKESPTSNYGALVEFWHKEDSQANPIGNYRLDLRASKQIDEPGFQYVAQLTNDIAIWSIKPGNVAWRTSPSMPIVDNNFIKAFNDAGVIQRSITTVSPTVGQTVTMFGYGCNTIPPVGSQPVSDFKKRYGSNTIVEISPTVFPTHFTTFIGASGNLAQGCPGDSGGPAFNGTSDTSAIIGINSGATSSYQNSLIARIDGNRGHWINKQVATPIIDSHNNKVFKNLSSFKVYGYKLDATGANSTKTVLKFRYGTAPNYTYATANSTTVGCPAPVAGEGAFACFETVNLPSGQVGDWIASRQVSIGGVVRTLETIGQGKVRVCANASTTCPNP